MKIGKINWLLIAIIALGLAIRVWGLGFGLPYMYHPDEGVPVVGALKMLHTGDLNPHFFHWSSLLFYLNALAYGVFFVLGLLTGRFASPTDLPLPDVETIAVGKTALPELFLISRGLTAAFGVISIFVIYRICRQFRHGEIAGLVAALWLAVEPVDVRNSQFIRPDTFVVTFVLASVFFSLRILDDPRLRNYILAGIAAGLAASFKYNAALVCLPILAAHLLRFNARGFARREIYIAAGMSALAFLVTTPFALLDLPRFVEIGPLQAASIYATGHAGAEGNTIQWYLTFLQESQGALFLLGLAGAALLFVWRERQAVVLAAFPVAYYALVNLYTVHFDETVLPVIPFLIIFAALGVARVYAVVRAHWAAPMIWRAALVALTVLVALPPLAASAQNNAHILQPDGRESARVWIENNLPHGARVALEPYAPYVDRANFTVEGFEEITAHPPEWYAQNGFEYIVLSYGSYGRFLENPALYAETVNRYNAFFTQLTPVARFDDSGYEVRVLRTNATGLPAARVGARWGIFAPWLELVGYDWNAPTLTLYWRGLQARHERMTLTTRLLGSDHQEIATATGELSEGINTDHLMVITRTIAAPPDPGLYQIELDVDAAGQGRVPVLAFDNKALSDKYFLSPVKFPPAPLAADEISRARPVKTHLGDSITLLGYTLQSGNLLLYWQSAKKMDKDYTVFIHLLDASGRVSAQVDAAPCKGVYPTSLWEPGEIIRDEHTLFDLLPGKYTLELGLYEYPGLSRLAITDANGNGLGDHLDMEVIVQ